MLPVLDVTDKLHVFVITLNFIHITSEVLQHRAYYVAYFTLKKHTKTNRQKPTGYYIIKAKVYKLHYPGIFGNTV